ncbi:MAG: CARDB domain-containing protein [Anaerolineae bacterium]
MVIALIVLLLSYPSSEPVRAIFTAESVTSTLYLPWVTKGYVPPSGRLCRFGVGADTGIASYAVNSLRIGWYIDWTATRSPARPGGITYMPIIRLQQTGTDSYTYFPSGSTLSATVTANPGALWLIGNEPDRRRWQDSLEPHIYAQAYHELYHLLKSLDSTAQVAAGGIVQPTPLRLQYLDMVLEEYRKRYGEPMPVDIWNIHAFILRERSCDYYPDDCWGAEIPPGIDAPEGMLYDIQDNDNIEIFRQHIERFRQWMADRGYQNCPLIVTEFGVQMPYDFGFPPERVNVYMNATFDYLMTATSPLGYPADEYRLVQRWAWYSLADNHYNGWLFDPETKARTVFGDNFATYTSRIAPTVNLAPVRIWTEPIAPFSSEEAISLTLYVEIVNNGNIATVNPVLVRFYEGLPDDGVQIGSDQFASPLDGCASKARIAVHWANVTPGVHPISVIVDPQDSVAESDESDNILRGDILVATSRLWLPAVYQMGP